MNCENFLAWNCENCELFGMLHAQTSQEKKKRHWGRAQRFELPLRQASAALGVDHSHLYRVLAGERESRSLTRRYQELVKTTFQK